jgi:RNA polymerase sigma-70 factor, ECF subfamily
VLDLKLIDDRGGCHTGRLLAIETPLSNGMAGRPSFPWPDSRRSAVHVIPRAPMTTPADFPEAYGRFLAPIRAKCRRLLGQNAAADDVAQEAFVRLWRSGPPLDGKTETRTIMAWLYLTSTRLAVDAMREGRMQSLDALSAEPMSCLASPDAVVAARTAIAALCKKVPGDEIEAALLARVDGLSQPEVALVLGVSERTVRRLLERFDEHSAALRKELAS